MNHYNNDTNVESGCPIDERRYYITNIAVIEWDPKTKHPLRFCRKSSLNDWIPFPKHISDQTTYEEGLYPNLITRTEYLRWAVNSDIVPEETPKNDQ